MRRFQLGALTALLLALCVQIAVADDAPTAPQPSPDKPAVEEWRRDTTTARPTTNGCFELEYPSKQWKEVDCGKQPADAPRTFHLIVPPHTTHAAAALTGNYLITPVNKINSATGTVLTLNGINKYGSDSAGSDRNFSIQLNSNNDLPAKTGSPSCKTSTNAKCSGWIQFVYNNQRQLFIQFWLIHYKNGDSCPSEMTFESGDSCGANAAFKTLVDTPTNLQGLQGATLTGQATSDGHGGGTVSALLTVNGKSYLIVATDPFGSLSPSWSQAEFNVFGDQNSRRVTFNPEAQIQIGLNINNDTSHDEPGCATGSTTGESSNLFLGPCFTTTAPGIWFDETPTLPVLTGLSPPSGSSAGGTRVRLLGDFPEGRRLQFKFGQQIASVPSESSADFTVISPPGAVGAQVSVTAAYIFPDGSPGPFSADSPATQFTYFKVPVCTFADYCPFYEGQPPTYEAKCDVSSDYYMFSGQLPADPAHPNRLMPVQMGGITNSGLMSAEQLHLFACSAGTTSNCYISSIEIDQKHWCLNNAPPPPPPRCSQCGGKKCCPDPLGGIGHVCVALDHPCPPFQ